MCKFCHAVDKLSEMEVIIHNDLLAILLLYYLLQSFVNFRNAIESRDDLQSPKVLYLKIIEENDFRNSRVKAELITGYSLSES